MDFLGRKKHAELESLLAKERERYVKDLERLRGDLRFMIEHASDDQLVQWARESAAKVADLEDTEPDWVRRHADHLTNLAGRMLAQEETIKGLLEEQDWEIKIYKADGADSVRVIGKLDREQVPALLYRLAMQYADEELGSTVQASLRYEVDKYLRERDEAREELARIRGEQSE